MNYEKITVYFLRFSLAVSFLSAVADRFGLWGPPGANNVAWGNFENFVQYTAVLNPWMPGAVIPSLAWGATILEVVLGLLLIVGFRLKETALASAGLLMIFALSMTFTGGIKGPLNYSVFTAVAAALALFVMTQAKGPASRNR